MPIIEVDDQGEPTGKLLRLKITSPEIDWLKDDSVLTIVNPDGQKATGKYTLGPVVAEPENKHFRVQAALAIIRRRELQRSGLY